MVNSNDNRDKAHESLGVKVRNGTFAVLSRSYPTLLCEISVPGVVSAIDRLD